MRVGCVPLPLFPLTFLSLSLLSRPFFSLGGFLLASLVRGVGSLACLLHLLCVAAQCVQFCDRARFACFTCLPGGTLFALDAFHDVPEFACNPLCSFSFHSFTPLPFLTLPQPLGSFTDLRQALLCAPETVGAFLLLLPFEFTLPDDLSNVLKTFACPIGTLQFVGSNQFTLSGDQGSAQLYGAGSVGPGDDLMLEPVLEIASHCPHVVGDGPRDLLTLHRLPHAARYLAGLERCPLFEQLLTCLAFREATGFAFSGLHATPVGACIVDDPRAVSRLDPELFDPAFFRRFTAHMCTTELEVQSAFVIG